MARSFNGSSDGISVACQPSGNITNYSVSFWFIANALTNSYTGLWAANNQNAILIKSNGNFAIYNFVGSANNADPVSTNVYTTGVWYHVCVAGTFAPTLSNTILYVNGVSIGTVSSNNQSAFLTPIGIGYDNANAGRVLSGSMADPAHWTAQLTLQEVKALAAGARPNAIRTPSLVGWWPFGGIQSPEPDLSGFAKNGTLTGTNPAFGPPIMQFTPRWPQIFPVGPTFTLMPQAIIQM
jgi:hypothetical protein